MAHQELLEQATTRSVIGAFFDVYNTLRFGFTEHIYAEALEYELRAHGLGVGREILVPVMYKGLQLGLQRLDMVVEDRVVVETKATVKLHEYSHAQLRSYLRATNLEVGLLLHFGPEANHYRMVNRNSASRRRP